MRKNTDKLNHQQKIGLKYLEELEKKIPHTEMLELQAVVVDELQRLDSEIHAEICGSFRRGAAASGDIDVLLTHPKYTSTSEKKSDLFTALFSV